MRFYVDILVGKWPNRELFKHTRVGFDNTALGTTEQRTTAVVGWQIVLLLVAGGQDGSRVDTNSETRGCSCMLFKLGLVCSHREQRRAVMSLAKSMWLL